MALYVTQLPLEVAGLYLISDRLYGIHAMSLVNTPMTHMLSVSKTTVLLQDQDQDSRTTILHVVKKYFLS